MFHTNVSQDKKLFHEMLHENKKVFYKTQISFMEDKNI